MEANGKALYENLPESKKAGGPASFGLFRHDMKRPRNVKVHSQLPADGNASILRIKNGIVNDPGIHLSTKRPGNSFVDKKIRFLFDS
jgi:hypothetical protein